MVNLVICCLLTFGIGVHSLYSTGLENNVDNFLHSILEKYIELDCISGRIQREIIYDDYKIQLFGNFEYCDNNNFKLEYSVPFEKKISVMNGKLEITPPDSSDRLLLGQPNDNRFLDFNWGIIDELVEKYNFGFKWRGQIAGYDSVIVLEGVSKILSEIDIPKVMIWIDATTSKLLRFEGYNLKDACVLILTNDEFKNIDDIHIPIRYSIHLPIGKDKGEIITTLTHIKRKEN